MATIKNDRDLLLQSGIRILSTGISILASNSSFSTSENITLPTIITLTVSLPLARPSAIKIWTYALPTAPDTWIPAGSGDNLIITRESFLSAIGTGAYVEYRCYVTEPLYEDISATYKISYSSAGASGNSYSLNILGGIRAISYDKNGLNPLPAQEAFSASLYENDTLVSPTSYTWSATGVLSGTSTAPTFIPGSPTSYSASSATSITLTTTYTNGPSITQIVPISISKAGDDGISGTKSTTITAFKWSNAGIGTYIQAFSYTWSSGAVSAYPSGWTAAAPTSPGTGYTLYQISLIITATATATTTTTNWSSATSNTIGYRQDGSIGLQGASARIAYLVTTLTSPPGPPGTTTEPNAPAGWSTTATGTLAVGYYMYQSDGLLNGTTITWGQPYLSNLKVGSLSAISAKLGIVELGATGSLYSTGKSYGAGDGIFLGYSSTTYKLDVGSSSNYLRWDGTALSIRGDISGTSTLDITGKAVFSGVTTGFDYTTAVGVNIPNAIPGVGITLKHAIAGNPAIVGVYANFASSQSIFYAINTNNGNAVLGASTHVDGVGILANNSTTGLALKVQGRSTFSGQIVSTLAQGTAPIIVTSTTECTNLNASKLQGNSASAFATATHNHLATYISAINGNSGQTIPFAANSQINLTSAVGAYTFAGSGSTLSFNAVSDRRLKEDIVPEKLGLDFILKLKPVRYKLLNKDTDFHGFIAQDLDDIDLGSSNDSLRITNNDGTKGIDYVSIISPIVKALQELTDKVSLLELELEGLKNGKL